MLFLSLIVAIFPCFAEEVGDNNTKKIVCIIRDDYSNPDGELIPYSRIEHFYYNNLGIDTIMIESDFGVRKEKDFCYTVENYRYGEDGFCAVALVSFDNNDDVIQQEYSSCRMSDANLITFYRHTLGGFISGDFDIEPPHEIIYNDDNQIVKVKSYYTLLWDETIGKEFAKEDFLAGSFMSDKPYLVWDFRWENGNLVEGSVSDKDKMLGSFVCEYYADDICNNQFRNYNTPLIYNVFGTIHFVLQMDRGWLGNSCRNYLKSVNWTIVDSDAMDKYITENHLFVNDVSLTYEKEDDYVTKVYYTFKDTSFQKEFVWETINNIQNHHYDKYADQYSLYDLQGRRLKEKPQRGVYIENGKKKVIK